MSQLILSVGSKALTLTIDELLKHPESLLSSLISSMDSQSPAKQPVDQNSTSSAEGTEMGSEGSGYKSCWLSMKDDAWHLDLETMDLPIENDLKTVCLAQAAAILQAAYRHEYFPKPLWDNLLGKTLTPLTIDEQLKHTRLLHADISRILNFFNLPGPVTRWLPPIESLSICDARLLAFSYTCYQVQHAQAAVDTMLNYRPHQESNQPEHVAVFMVVKYDPWHGGPPSDCKPCELSVHVLKSVDAHWIAMLRQERARGSNRCAEGSPHAEALVFGSFTSAKMGLTTQLLANDGSLIGAANSLRPLGGSNNATVIGPSQVIGQELLVSLTSSIQGMGLSFGHGEFKVPVAGYPYDSMVTIPVWVLLW